MQFRILGPLEVVRDGEALRLGGPKQRALLAVLLLHADQPVALDRLVDELWGEHPPSTAVHTIQVYVSNLRKVIGAERLVTQPPGYLVRVEPDELDLERFERLLSEARGALAAGTPGPAAAQLREALGLWRGPALADFTYEAFAQRAIARLEELRLVAAEQRIDADLTLGDHAGLVAELQDLVEAHPLRERLRGQLMLALYRSGRQSEALDVFQQTRRLLVDELGIDPSPNLHELERAILQHSPELAPPSQPRSAPPPEPQRSILLAAEEYVEIERLLPFAVPLAAAGSHDLILAWAVPMQVPLEMASTALNELRIELGARGISVRAAAFTSRRPGRDLVRLASEQDVDLVLVDGEASLVEGNVAETSGYLLADAPSDVALLFARGGGEGAVVVPFGGGEHDWAALELGAWYASALGARLQLLGTAAEDETQGRDASRLLAHAALAVQRLAGVETEPVLAAPGEGMRHPTSTARLLVAGLADDWRHAGLGTARVELVTGAASPAALVRRGLRPGGLAPRETLTRFTWSLALAPRETAGAG